MRLVVFSDFVCSVFFLSVRDSGTVLGYLLAFAGVFSKVSLCFFYVFAFTWLCSYALLSVALLGNAFAYVLPVGDIVTAYGGCCDAPYSYGPQDESSFQVV